MHARTELSDHQDWTSFAGRLVLLLHQLIPLQLEDAVHGNPRMDPMCCKEHSDSAPAKTC